jgi:hypothetical protein
MRRHAASYLKGTKNAAEKRVRLNAAPTLQAMYEIVEED